MVQCKGVTACGRKKRKYFGVARYGTKAKAMAIASNYANAYAHLHMYDSLVLVYGFLK